LPAGNGLCGPGIDTEHAEEAGNNPDVMCELDRADERQGYRGIR